MFPAIIAGAADAMQAAVWIHTADLKRDDFKRYIQADEDRIEVVEFTGFGGDRVIDDSEIVRAMVLAQRAGVNLSHRAIWENLQILGTAPLKGADKEAWEGWVSLRNDTR